MVLTIKKQTNGGVFDDEDLSYGPGIVSKLRCRYMNLTLKEPSPKLRPTSFELRKEIKAHEARQPNDMNNFFVHKQGLRKPIQNLNDIHPKPMVNSSAVTKNNVIGKHQNNEVARSSIVESELPPTNVVKSKLQIFEPLSLRNITSPVLKQTAARSPINKSPVYIDKDIKSDIPMIISNNVEKRQLEPIEKIKKKKIEIIVDEQVKKIIPTLKSIENSNNSETKVDKSPVESRLQGITNAIENKFELLSRQHSLNNKFDQPVKQNNVESRFDYVLHTDVSKNEHKTNTFENNIKSDEITKKKTTEIKPEIYPRHIIAEDKVDQALIKNNADIKLEMAPSKIFNIEEKLELTPRQDNNMEIKLEAAPKFSNKKSTENSTIVFNFTDRYSIPDYVSFQNVSDSFSFTNTMIDVSVLDKGTANEKTRFKFLNSNIIIDGKSCLKSKDKNLKFNISFDDNLTSVFEYPSEDSFLEEGEQKTC